MASQGWDSQSVMSANLSFRGENDNESIVSQFSQAATTKTEARSKFRQFIREYRDQDDGFIYRDQLHASYQQGEYKLVVDCRHLHSFDSTLMQLIRMSPAEYVPVFEEACQEVVAALTVPRPRESDMAQVQIQLKNFEIYTDIRKLGSSEVAQLICVRGIIVSAGKPRIKATRLSIMCRNCQNVKQIDCGAGFGGARMPRECDTQYVRDSGLGKCGLDPFRILPDSSDYLDQQRLKMQENPELVPTGEMPRHISLSLDRYLVGQVKPGTRIVVVGIYTTYTAKANAASRRQMGGAKEIGIRLPYIRVLGIQQENDASDMLKGMLNPEDEDEMLEISRQPDLYQKMANSIAPNIYGSEDIKKAIACQLFGGARKHLPDGMRLRGDVNILLLGDPSVGKSQFLKFAIQAAPIGVYTSGKGSSAAGLTASVIRDPSSGDFHLEGGALVLADGGLVCIDEFDKMREQDRVAIHEAMEQQTISIAKAGITTILNSRTSVLAAANPIFSRYDDMKSPTENIDFQTTILSRFDLIFIVKDTQEEKKDILLAKHIINIHKNTDSAARANNDNEAGQLEMDRMKKYVAFARMTCQPRLSENAAELLKSRYVTFRKTMRQQKEETGANAIPITVRQLEAIVRLSESLARMELKQVADENHVKEALRLFKVSTYQAATSKTANLVGGAHFNKSIENAVSFINSRVYIGSSQSVKQLVSQLMHFGHDENAAMSAIATMVRRQTLQYTNQQKNIKRIR